MGVFSRPGEELLAAIAPPPPGGYLGIGFDRKGARVWEILRFSGLGIMG
jgi:hypothetical protein